MYQTIGRELDINSKIVAMSRLFLTRMFTSIQYRSVKEAVKPPPKKPLSVAIIYFLLLILYV